MANTLQDLRREAGFKSAKDYAEHLGIPAPTYARYENKPEKIPLAAAWNIADDLGCSIDAVVGREHIDVEKMRGPVQALFDSFTPETKRLVKEFLEFSAQRDARAAAAKLREEERRYDVVFSRYYELFLQEANEQPEVKNAIVFGSAEQRRAAFAGFVASSLASTSDSELESAFGKEQRELFLTCAVREHGQSDEQILAEFEGLRAHAEAKYRAEEAETLERVMAAYDRNRADEDLLSEGAAANDAQYFAFSLFKPLGKEAN